MKSCQTPLRVGRSLRLRHCFRATSTTGFLRWRCLQDLHPHESALAVFHVSAISAQRHGFFTVYRPELNASPSSSTPTPPTNAPAMEATSSPQSTASVDGTTTSADSSTPTNNNTNNNNNAPPAEAIVVRWARWWQQGVMLTIGAVTGIGVLVYVLYAPVKEDTVHHTAVVASEALSDRRLRAEAIKLSKDVVDKVLNDPNSLVLVSSLVQQLLAKEDTKIAVSSLLQSLFEDHYTQEVTKKFVLRIVRDPWIQDQLQIIVKDQVLQLLQDPSMQTALTNYLVSSASESLQKPSLHVEAARAVRGAVQRVFFMGQT